jgi:hypothetical protein
MITWSIKMLLVKCNYLVFRAQFMVCCAITASKNIVDST